VPSVPGQFATLKDSLDRILTELDQLDVQKLFNHVDELILTTGRAVEDANVPGLAQQVQALFADLRVTNTRLQGLLARPGSEKEDKETANIALILEQLSTTLSRLNLLAATQAPRLESILANFARVSSDLKELSASLKRTPSDLLFSGPPRKSELMK
jgi:hypothetical protein